MTTQTATKTAPTAKADGQLTLKLDLGLKTWIAEQRATVTEWYARGDRYKAFVTAYDTDTIAAFGAYIDDLAIHLSALDTPAVTGLPSFSGRDLLTELRNLRNLNDNLVRSGGRGIVRRAVGSRTKIRWGITAGEGSAQVYSAVTDQAAKSLAIALKS